MESQIGGHLRLAVKARKALIQSLEDLGQAFTVDIGDVPRGGGCGVRFDERTYIEEFVAQVQRRRFPGLWRG